MRKTLFLWSGFGIGGCLFILGALYFEQIQYDSYKKMKKEWTSLQAKVRALEENEVFLRDHQREISFLSTKGWLVPKNRLVADDTLGKIKNSLNNLAYRFEPEVIKKEGEEHTFKVTLITLTGEALLDGDVYDLLHTLFESFTGIIRSRELVLTRRDNMNHKNHGSLGGVPGVDVKFVFEWISMGEKEIEE